MSRTLSQWLSWLESVKPVGVIDLNLDRMSLVGKKLELLKPAPLVITVGGTNGKGSVVALLESILLEAGYSVGAFTSPYLLHVNEQFRINGVVVSNDLLVTGFEVVQKGCEGVALTNFEFLTCVAAYCFLYSRVDIVINEVGLGGRLDATNIFNSDISVITSIGYDHQEWLGNSLEEIAYEKTCIMRSGNPGVYGGELIPEIVADFAKKIGAYLLCKNNEFMVGNVTSDSWGWVGLGADRCPIYFENLPKPKILLTNASTVLQVLQFMPKPIERCAIEQGLRRVRLPGRYQKLQLETPGGDSVELVADVAHNPQAAEVLGSRLVEDYPDVTVWMVIAMCNDKDYIQFIHVLLPCVTHWVCTETQSARALACMKLEQVFYEKNCPCLRYDNVSTALQKLLADKVSAGDIIVVTGSFKVIAEAMTFLKVPI